MKPKTEKEWKMMNQFQVWRRQPLEVAVALVTFFTFAKVQPNWAYNMMFRDIKKNMELRKQERLTEKE